MLAALLLASPLVQDLPIALVARDGAVAVELGGEPFCEYRYAGVPKPILYPLIGPGGARMTRAWPQEERPGEARDHPHHQSLWFAHGSVAGHDFWHGGAGERIVQDGEPWVAEDGAGPVLRARHRWLAPDGAAVCLEEREMRFRGSAGERTLDFAFTLRSAGGDVLFGDTKEGTFALRLAPTLQLKGEAAAGAMLASNGARDGECWGKRAAWIDCSGPIDGRVLGVAVFDHPDNPRHPTWWHARDYGLLAANPFGVHDFEKAARGSGDLMLAQGQRVTFRYRVLLHAGALDAAGLDELWSRWAAERDDPLAERGPVELVAGGFRFTEGPAWSASEGALYFTDIPSEEIQRFVPGAGVSLVRGASGGANGLAFDRDGRLVACEHGGRRVSASDAAGATTTLVDALGGARLNSPNDLALARDGTLYFSDPPYGLAGRPSELGASHVLRRDPSGALHVVWKGELDACPNGVALAPDERTLYVAFTRAGDVRSFALDSDGAAGAARPFVTTAGDPDGMALDRRGNLYVATRAGVEVFAPDGRALGLIEVPEQPANCAFGDADARTLYVTARTGLYRVRLARPGRY